MTAEDKPQKLIEYVITAPNYYEYTYDRAEAMQLGREHRGDVEMFYLSLDRWGACYDVRKSEIIMRGGVPVTPSLDDWGDITK